MELQDLQESVELMVIQEFREIQELQVADLHTEVYGIRNKHITLTM
jgi:hypothetical protein